MLNAILLAIALIAGFALGLWLFAYYILRPLIARIIQNKAEKARIAQADPLIAGLNPQHPALVYFTSADCVPCKTMQRPAIERLQRELKDLQLITVDTPSALDAAERWGVLKLPRTFIIGRNFHVYGTNMNVTSTEILKKQLAEAMEADGSAPMQVFRA
jgi:thiol-disulfide isomerase/thioredoxin